jgi:hypothetical protein
MRKAKQTEGITAPAIDLGCVKTALEAARDRHIATEERFAAALLPDRLCIGLHCFQAHCHFAVSPQKRNPKGRNQHSGEVSSPREETSSFSAWLANEVPWLKEPTAYKYMSAFRGLGLDETADEQLVLDTLSYQRRIAAANDLPAPSLASMVKACAALLGPPRSAQVRQQQEFDFLKDRASELRETVEAVLRLKADLQSSPDLHKTVCARLYGALFELTGTHWKPSEEADDLAHVDPDHIEI